MLGMENKHIWGMWLSGKTSRKPCGGASNHSEETDISLLSMDLTRKTIDTRTAFL
jgi:hypothetical protein